MPKTAPVGSANTAMRPMSITSIGSTITPPPAVLTFSATSSASAAGPFELANRRFDGVDVGAHVGAERAGPAERRVARQVVVLACVVDEADFADRGGAVVPCWVVRAFPVDQHVALEHGFREVRVQGVQTGCSIAALHAVAVVGGDVVRVEEAPADAFGGDHVASLEDGVVVDREIARAV